MFDKSLLYVPKWPFFVGDAILLGLAVVIYAQSRLPLGHWEMAACAVCVLLGALLGVLPFLLDYRIVNQAIQAQALGAVSEKIQNLERLAAQISSATNHWENVQLNAEKTSQSAREIADRMAAEVHGFTDFMKKINESEKSTLRLEVEKLRRSEGDWVQVLVHVLDHVHALHVGAVRSGQPRLIKQLSLFQNACRDAARRVGLNPFVPAPGEVFDAQRHQPPDDAAALPADPVVAEVIAAGYTLQGRQLRQALVRVTSKVEWEATAAASQAIEQAQDQLALEIATPN